MPLAEAALPTWVQAWLAWLAAIAVGSVAFVRGHAGARWTAGGFAASVLLLLGVAVTMGAGAVTIGLVAMSHAMFWTPPLLYLAFAGDEIETRSAYGLWSTLATASLGFSLFFDWRDTALYLWG